MIVMLSPLLCYFTFLYQQKLVRHAMSQHLQHEKLATVKVEKSKVIWINHNKEVIINGKLFDIRHVKAEGEYLILYGLFDHEEDIVQMKLNHLSPFRRKTENPVNLTVIRLITTPFLVTEILTPLSVTSIVLGMHKTGNFLVYQSKFVSVKSPPPKSV